MSKSRLQKLLYLVERQAVLETGRPAIGIRFKNEQFGMWSPAVADSLQVLADQSFLTAKRVASETGEGARYSVATGKSVQVDSDMQRFCEEIKRVYGRKTLHGLIVDAKRTAPFIYSKRGEWVDWRLLEEEVCASTHNLTAQAESEIQSAAERIRQGRTRIVSREEALKELEARG